jgi:small-conductance mechanosensitive channel
MMDLQKYTDKAIELLMRYGPKLLLAILILIIGFWLIKLFIKLLGKAMLRSKIDLSLQRFSLSLVSILLKIILKNDTRILKDSSPTVAVSELADSSVNFVVRDWCNTPDYWDVYFDMPERVKLEFDEQGISIPFPQRDVRVYNN